MTLGFGAARGKVFQNTILDGEGARGKVTGAYAVRNRQHLDFDTTQEHAAANTTSDLAFRGILADRSSAVWRGMIKVDPGAQQTDAFQESRNLLVSKKAHADAIPGLEILANDVRCTHAAAIAQIDPEQVYYLRSRGLRREVAQRLVIEGFMAELVERFEEGDVRDALAAALERRLEAILGLSRVRSAAVGCARRGASWSSASSRRSTGWTPSTHFLLFGLFDWTGHLATGVVLVAALRPSRRTARGSSLGSVAHRPRPPARAMSAPTS